MSTRKAIAGNGAKPGRCPTCGHLELVASPLGPLTAREMREAIRQAELDPNAMDTPEDAFTMGLATLLVKRQRTNPELTLEDLLDTNFELIAADMGLLAGDSKPDPLPAGSAPSPTDTE